jgi:hypothetical protein
MNDSLRSSGAIMLAALAQALILIKFRAHPSVRFTPESGHTRAPAVLHCHLVQNVSEQAERAGK